MESERPRIRVKRKKQALSSEQRAGFVLVAFTGAGAVLIGIFYMIRAVQAPFDISYEGPILLSPAEERAIEIERQRNQDTDGDGLTDYEELYELRTSPFLRDTDGDGISDAAEQELDGSGVATSPQLPASQSQNEFVETFGDIFGSGFFVEGGGVDSINQAVTGGGVEDLENVTPELLRESLRAQGATEDQLRYITDQQLLQRYLDLLDQYQELQEQESSSTGSEEEQQGSSGQEEQSDTQEQTQPQGE